MFIETKKKGKRGPSLRWSSLDRYSIGQVASYAALFKKNTGKVVPFIATADPETIVVFKTPEEIDRYVNWKAVKERDYGNVLEPTKYRLLLEKYLRWRKKLGLDEEYVYFFMSQLAQEYLKKKGPKSNRPKRSSRGAKNSWIRFQSGVDLF